jgi:hypothetical protein
VTQIYACGMPPNNSRLGEAVRRVRMSQNHIEAAYRARAKAIQQALALGVSHRELAALVGDDPTTGKPIVSAATIGRDAQKVTPERS